MFTIKEVTNYTLLYSCECGAIGKCVFVPVDVGGKLVLDLKCPMCGENERLCIETGNENDKLIWAIILDNSLEGE